MLQDDNSLLQTRHDNWEQTVRTEPDTDLPTTLLQLLNCFQTYNNFRIFTSHGLKG